MTNKKKILAITGIRSEYDILYPVLVALEQSDLFDLHLVVSGAHLSSEHGYTYQSIVNDGFNIVDCIDSLLATERLTQRPKAIASLISGLSQTVERIKPDFLLVVGDREESIASAIVANYMEVLLAHIGGGDPVFGNADDPIRMAVSKLAHIHFSTTQSYANNLITLGEDNWRIKFCGTPGLDNIANEPLLPVKAINDFLNIDLQRYVVVLKHPLSSEHIDAYQQMKMTLTAVDEFCQRHDFKAVVIQPNSDPGAKDILRAIDEHQGSKLIFTHTLPRNIFINLIRHTQVLIGNSSMGILEAPMHKLPVVNVGSRQQGRLNAGNVEFVGYDVDNIITAIEKAALDLSYRKKIACLANPYGEGNAATIIVDFLSEISTADKHDWQTKQSLVYGVNQEKVDV